MAAELPLVEVVAVCHDCRRQHTYREVSTNLAQAMADWHTKHAGHPVAFSRPRPLYTARWLRKLRDFWSACPAFAPLGYQYGHNADDKVSYVASADYTITLASLATSSTWVVGRESTVITNSSNYLDYMVGGIITTGTTPTASTEIRIYAFAAYKDTPLYSTPISGAGDAGLTFSTQQQRDSAIVLAGVAQQPDTTSNRTFGIALFSVKALYAQQVGPPKYHGLFVTHNTGVNLNSTSGNHQLTYTGVYGTIA